MATKHTQDELDGLTVEERAGLLDGDTVDEGDREGIAAATKAEGDKAAKSADKKDAKPEPEELDETEKLSDAEIDAAAAAAVAEVTAKPDAKKADEKKGPDVDKDAAAAVAAVASADDKKPAETADDGKDERSTVPSWVVPADADKKLGEIATKKSELSEKFDAGDLSAKDYQTELDKLIASERDIHDAGLLARAGHDMRVATWSQEVVPDFLDDHPQYRDNETLNGMLDAEVRKQQVAASKDGKNPFSPKILDRAHANITGAIEALTGKPAGKTEEKPKTPKVETKQRPPLPPTLAKVPAAEATETGSNRFAALDRLSNTSPAAFERALEKLPQEVRDEYLASSN